MLARIGKLALQAVVLSLFGLAAVAVVSFAWPSAELPPPKPRRDLPTPGLAARPWLAPAPPEEYTVDPPGHPNPEVFPAGPSAQTLTVLLAVCVLVAIVCGVLIAVILGSGGGPV